MVASTSAGDFLTDISKRWGRFVALGIAMVVLGVIALLDVVAVTIASTVTVSYTHLTLPTN